MGEAALTIPRLVEMAAERHGDHPAVIEDGEAISFAELADRADEAARAFLGAGVEVGDRVSIWAPNIGEWIIALLGLQRAGAVLVPLNTRYKGTEAADVLSRSRARILLTVEGFLGNDYVQMLRGTGADLPDLERIVILRGDAPEGTERWLDLLASAEDVDPERSSSRAAQLSGRDLSDILFTSGTTGAPKGVMAAHGQNIEAIRWWSELVGLREGDRYLIANPFFHSFGYKAGIVASILRGATMLPMPVFDVAEVIRRIERDRISMLPGPPTLYQSILDDPGRAGADLSSWRLAVTGAAAIPVQMIERMRDELKLESIITAYGLTEACGFATACRKEDDAETIATTSGRAMPGIEVRCVDEGGGEVPAGHAGEVVIRGYNVMVGYFEDPDATAATIDPDGWLHTGDVGVMDDAGYLKITDRLKDMFIVGGFNAYPAEIEGILLRHPAIAQVAVVGVPDERLGEVGVAFVVPRPGFGSDEGALSGELSEWARQNMANYKVPRRFELVTELPMNATGKVLKYELREWAGTAGR